MLVGSWLIDQSERIGCIGVAVDSKADAVGYYGRFVQSAMAPEK
jgi:hypothetical protein